jgi:N-acetylglutamate synthase/N-acetylornithine aminotransferase
LASKSEKVVVFEDGTEFSIAQEKLESLLSGEEIQLGVELGCGNYGATAFGCLSPKFIKPKVTIEKNA